MFKFSANISTLFTEYPFLERFKKARDHGFSHVEMQFPYEYQPDDIARGLCGRKCVLINTYCGKDDFGYASIPGKEIEFCNSLTKIVPYYMEMDFPKVHIMAGTKCSNITEEEQFNKFVSSLDSATSVLEEYNLTGLIEPICPDVIENYFLSSFDMAVRVMQATSNENIKLLLDIYHLHKITGDVKKYLPKYYPYAGHIQISQDPDRREPFYSGGKIDYEYVFNFLKEKNHQDFIGLEYFPSETTEKSLEWMKKYV